LIGKLTFFPGSALKTKVIERFDKLEYSEFARKFFKVKKKRHHISVSCIYRVT